MDAVTATIPEVVVMGNAVAEDVSVVVETLTCEMEVSPESSPLGEHAEMSNATAMDTAFMVWIFVLKYPICMILAIVCNYFAS